MKLIYAIALSTFSLTAAAASPASARPCYDVAVSVKQAFGSETQTYLPTGAKVCVTGKDTKPTNEETLRTEGHYRIEITNAAGRRVSLFNARVKTDEGALGTYYVTYGASATELDRFENGEYAEALQFRLRNDRIPRGEYAGRLTIQGTELTLLAR
jgi:hypothetical protein